MTKQNEDIARITVAVNRVIQRARELDLPIGLLGEVLVDQGVKLVLQERGRDAAVVWLTATLSDLESKGFETTGPAGNA